ncbi:MAG: hypothetical protein FJY67_05040 [Calditrichaeota bacterium]|nr:hypothetical protein [Calditrichota bacterium]
MKRMNLPTLLALACLSGCAAETTVHLGGSLKGDREIVLTTGSLDQPVRSIGITQVSRYGLALFGFFDLWPADLREVLNRDLRDAAARTGADAVVNLQFFEMQYPAALKILSILTVVSPRYAFATGELVEFVR